MARIIYKEGCEGQNTLESIEGIEIDLLNGQKALIYPKYDYNYLLKENSEWSARCESVEDAIRAKSSQAATDELLRLESPAARYVRQFKSERYGYFNLPTLVIAMEFQNHKKEIDAIASTIEGADLLQSMNNWGHDMTETAWSCSRGERCYSNYCRVASDSDKFSYREEPWQSAHLCVPTAIVTRVRRLTGFLEKNKHYGTGQLYRK